MSNYKILQGHCLTYFSESQILEGENIDLTFLDPPFNQDKEYNSWNDNLPEHEYWQMMEQVCKGVYKITSDGGGNLFYAEREKY